MSRADSASELASSIQAAGRKVIAIQADSANPDAISEAVRTAVDELGPLDVVVVNAGILRINTVEAVALEELDLMIDVNIRGVFLAIQAAVAQMKDGGRVVTIGSNTAKRSGFQGSSVYQFTKAAVAAMVKGLALDLAPRQITVNNVQPGPTNTDMNTGSIEFLTDRSPLKRVADPAEIAELVSYLAGPGSSYMTGSSLTIDGGWVL